MKKIKKMKQAAIDQILLWLVLLTIFVSFLFLVIDYSVALRIKDNVDALADYGSRLVALGRTDAEVVAGMNNVKLTSMATIQEADLSCTTGATSNYQVQFTVQATFSSTFFDTGANNVRGKTVVFNEISDLEKTCTVTITFN